MQSDKLRHFPEKPEILNREKDRQRAELAGDIERYLAAGGIIETVGSHRNREARLRFNSSKNHRLTYANDEDKQRRNNRGRDISIRGNG